MKRLELFDFGNPPTAIVMIEGDFGFLEIEHYRLCRVDTVYEQPPEGSWDKGGRKWYWQGFCTEFAYWLHFSMMLDLLTEER